MLRALFIACFATSVVTACATGGTGTQDTGNGDGTTTGDAVRTDTLPADAPRDIAADIVDVPMGALCHSDGDCTAPDLCMNAQRCQFGRCVVIGGIDACDDQVACTDDQCDAAHGRCIHTANDTRCPTGRFCDPANGCVSELPCELGDQTCARLNTDVCTGTWSCDAARLVCLRSAPPNCTDTDPCTADTCMASGTGYMCNHMAMFDYQTNVMNCGGCMMACPARANSMPACMTAMCSWMCAPMYVDLNHDLNAPRSGTSDGCECQITNPVDVPDLMFQDTNCDGIDGTITHAVFVSARGDDNNDGSMMHPLRTIQAGIAMAQAAVPSKDVYVSLGTFMGTIALASGVSIYGGYNDLNNWSRGNGNVTTIQGTTQTGVIGSGLGAPVELQLLTIRALDATMPGTSSYGIRIANSGNVTLRACNVYAGNGAAGTPGSNGIVGARGGDGTGGSNGGAGTGGSSPCGVGGGNGGGAVSGGNNGHVGSPGSMAPLGGAAGNGGSAGQPSGGCVSNGTNAPSDAQRGQPGTNGINGASPPPLGTLMGDGTYGPPASPSGTSGTSGGGGGGGGSGSGSNHGITCASSTSGGGGGGGAGGCGGTAGTGGRGGGGSFAVVSVASMLVTEQCHFFTSQGGNGGNGGNGGVGGFNGNPGAGGPGAQTAGDGAAGAQGGSGGSGGSGSGGTGGPAICVLYVGGAPSMNMNMCSRGTGGSGGTGGSNASVGMAPNGAAGISDDTRAGM